MASDAVEIDLAEVAQLQRTMRQMEDGKRASANLTKRVRLIAEDAARDVRKVVQGIPVESEGGYRVRRKKNQAALGLRASVAASIEVKTAMPKRGVNVRIRASRTKFMAASGRPYPKLPRYLEGMSRKQWRHPVFLTRKTDAPASRRFPGTSAQWVYQESHPYLIPTVLRRRTQLGEAMREEYEKTFDEFFSNNGISTD